MRPFIKNISSRPFSVGFILLYVLPPAGMAWFIVLAMMKWGDSIRRRRLIPGDSISILLTMMILASVGAALSHHQS
ncbi:hypothetical protein [Sporolactobacillus sp. THM19-2]|uniref:hypothetical protein n=1 Tax=Sporolactobacillus sp. THM19-2 TaxID=2511171 RepID=UPI00101FBA25|nr:hypothetical protein [Sporolactobacillus sp. THM19-2]RYL88867.1 hypothetical protein EWH91_11065 [Sporolactobacillus sp. THM19-2]